MKITRENMQELDSMAETLVEQLEAVKEAISEWESLQDEPRTEEMAEDIRAAREELEESIEQIDASSLCQLIHGKHKGK